MANVEAFCKILGNLADTAPPPVYKKKAFQNAAASLKAWALKSNSSVVTLDDAKQLSGFGAGIIRRLDEYIKSGKLEELKGTEEKSAALELFEGIYGVGPVIANRWFEMGYRNLSDIPQDSLTDSQKLGLKYYHDINSKIHREEIAKIEAILLGKTQEFNRQRKCELKFQICGSYLRGKPTSGDIDIIITEPNGKLSEVFDSYIRYLHPYIEHVLARGDAKALCIGYLLNGKRCRIDFELVEPAEWPFALLYFTGSKEFNKYIRGVAKDKGYTLNQKELSDMYFSLGASDEREIFDFLQIPFQTPAERDKY